jgi:hypothetical protein
MAITNILTTGTTEANSADVVVAAGTPITVCLKDAAGPSVSGAVVYILLKDDAGQYFKVGELSGTGEQAARVITAPGTYRFSRPDGISCGVFSA